MQTEKYLISELIEDMSMGPFGSNIKKKNYTSSGVPYLNGSNVSGFVLSEDTFKYVSEEKADSLKKAVAYRGDIIVTHRGTLGQIAYIPHDSKYKRYVTGNSQFRFTCNDKVLPDFLVFYFHTRLGQHKLLSNASQVGVPALAQPTTSFKKLQIDLPDIITQKKICSIIHSIQNKINTNYKINRNLDAQMQTLFDDILYKEFESGNKENLGDFLYVKGRIGWKGLKRSEYVNHSDYRIINGESLTKAGIDWSKAGYITKERYDESPEIMLEVGDILISKDGTIGKVGYVNYLEKPTTVASGIFVVRNIKPDEISTVFIYCLFMSSYFKKFIASRTEGSVIPHLYQKDFVTLEIPLLTKDNLKLFNEDIVPLFELYYLNNSQNDTLSTLRDTLLPKLMSGQLDVSDLDI